MPSSIPRLIEAWGALAALSGVTAILTLSSSNSGGRTGLSAAVLILAGLKARVILARYLSLGTSRFWMRTFDLAIGGFLAAAFALYLAGGGA